MKNKIYRWFTNLHYIFTDIKTKQVLRSYGKWLALATTLAFLAYLSAEWTNTHYNLTEEFIRILQLISSILMISLLGQRGPEIQTWGGNSPSEKLNRKLFIIFYASGYFILIYSMHIKSC